MYGGSASDESEDEGCYVFWDTPSILPPAPRPTAPLAVPSPPRRTSQRSGAPSPSLGGLAGAAAGTPKPKRTTAVAALPSPSGSATGSKATSRPLRQRKRLKGLRRGASEASSQPLDARALQMVSQLAMKVNARTASMSSPALSRATTGDEAVPEGKGKGKAVNSEPVVKREPLRPSPTANVPTTSTSTTPLRRTPARAARAAAHAPLGLSTTKPTTARAAPPGKKAAPVPVPVPAPAATAVPPARPPLGKSTSSATVTTVDDFDSFFNDGDDTFELALSQLDELAVVPTPPSSAAPAPPPAPKPKPKPVPAPARTSARGSDAPPVVRAAPAPQPAPRAVPLPPRRASPADSAPAPCKPAAAPALILRSARSSQGTPAQQRAMAELAQREADALAADLDLGAGGWSDVEDF